jgi:DNA-binding CsgD family transcriptional regulator
MDTGEELMRERYMLPAAAVIETMKQKNEIVCLQAHVPALPGHREEGTAFLLVGQDKIHSCTIVAASGEPLFAYATEALKVLEQLGDLEWILSQVPTYQQVTDHYQRADEEIPRRAIPALSPAQEKVLSRREKQVFALVDGQRSREKIARILQLEQGTVQQMLQKLREVFAVV